MATRVILTYADYAAIPADGRRYELYEGEIFVTPAPTTWHQRVIRNLFDILHHYVVALGLGEVLFAPVDCILNDTTVVQPDIVFVEMTRLSAISARGIEGPPTLAVEVVSDSTRQIDRSVKFQLYARHGVPYYWIVDPASRTIDAFVLRNGVYQLAARLAGTEPAALLPFLDLLIDPASLWP